MLARQLHRGWVGSTFDIRSTGVGGLWEPIVDAVAMVGAGKAFVTCLDVDGTLRVFALDLASAAVSGPTNLGTYPNTQGVLHSSAGLWVRASDGRIVLSNIGRGASGGQRRVWISTNPDDISAFGSAVLIGSSTNYEDYTSLGELSGISGSPLYIVTGRYAVQTPDYPRNLTIYKSLDGGATWSGPYDLLTPTSGQHAIYWRLGTNPARTRLDLFYTDTDRVISPSSVYHVYLTGGNLYKSDGTLIGAETAGPYASSAGTLIQAPVGGASVYPSDWGYDGSGNPAAVVYVGSPSTTYKQARWTGSAWSLHDIATVTSGFLAYAGMTKDDPRTIIVPAYDGAHDQLYRYTSPDDATWTAHQLTNTAGSTNDLPYPAIGGAAGARFVFGRGRWNGDADYTMTVWVAR